MFVVRYRKFFFALSAILIAISVYGIVTYGFNYSIDFKGGTLTEVRYQTPVSSEVINEKIQFLDLGGFSVRPSGNNGFIIRTRELNQEEGVRLVNSLMVPEGLPAVERQTTIGPVAGEELKSKAQKAVAVVVIMIVLFITFAFRKAGNSEQGVSSWKYGLGTIVALAHDIIIPAGLFAFLGYFSGIEIDLLFVTGLLAILGYSVHDTIVVFDRVRENLKINNDTNRKEDFEITVGNSVTQTFARSINTSVTIFITLLALFLFGGEATRHFSLLLIVGVIIGTYSSIFVASPLLVTFQRWSAASKNSKKNK